MVERKPSRPWTEEQDALLISAVKLHGEHDMWKEVATQVPGRTNKACRKRWLHSLSPTVRKSPWTPTEDNQLLALYQDHGPKWSTIAREITGRTDDACSKRYREALDPGLKKDEWMPEEDEKLMQLFGQIGSKWGQLGQGLQRSGLGCRNRYRHLVKKASKLIPDPVPNNIEDVASPVLLRSGILDAGMQQENTLPLSPQPYSYCPRGTLPSFVSEQYSDEHIPSDQVLSSTSLSAALSRVLETRSLPTHTLYEQSSSGSCTSDLGNSGKSSVSEDIPLLFAQDRHLTHIFSNVHFEDGVFYYHESDFSPSPHYGISENEPWELSDFIPTACSTQAPLHGLEAHHNSFGNPSSTLSSPCHVSLSLSEATSPNPLTPIELPVSRPPANFVPPPSEPASSPRRKARTVARRTIRPPGFGRLSSMLTLMPDPSVMPYACGRERCWPAGATASSACFTNSKELLDHSRNDHIDDAVGDKPFRCALAGCGKSWKNVNGLQYHLQLSMAHFRTAMSSSFSSQPQRLSGSSSRRPCSGSRTEVELCDDAKRTHVCHHPQCFKAYKQASGLKYHLKHGHPLEMPAQLPVVPPALARQLPSKTKKMRQKPHKNRWCDT